MLLLRENTRVTLHVVGHDALLAEGLEGTERALLLLYSPPQLLAELRSVILGRRWNDHFIGFVAYCPGGCQAVSVVSINVMSFLVVCCKPFADRVGVGTQSTLEKVVLAFWLCLHIIMFDAVVPSYPLLCGTEVFAELTPKHYETLSENWRNEVLG